MQTEFLLSMIDEKATQPSLFELYFLESIVDLVKPALRHLLLASTPASETSLTAPTTTWTTTLRLWLSEHFESIFSLVQFAADASCLYQYRAGLLVERLYALERVSTTTTTTDTTTANHTNNDISNVSIDMRQKLWSLLLFVVLPQCFQLIETCARYLAQISDPHAEHDSDNRNDSPSNSNTYNSNNSNNSNTSGTSNSNNNTADYNAENTYVSTLRMFLAQCHRRMVCWTHRLLTFLLYISPYIQLTSHFVTLSFRLLYVLGLSPYHHPLFALLSMKLMKSRHVTTIGSTNYNSNNSPTTTTTTNNSSNSSSNLPLKVLFTTIFALRGVNWFVQQDFQEDHLSTRLSSSASSLSSHRNNSSNHKIPFPKVPTVAKGGIRPTILHNNNTATSHTRQTNTKVNDENDEKNSSYINNSANNSSNSANNSNNTANNSASTANNATILASEPVCALCQQPHRHPTATPSGFVFCFKCISGYVQEWHRCPVTHQKCSILDLIRLYPNSNSTTNSSTGSNTTDRNTAVESSIT